MSGIRTVDWKVILFAVLGCYAVPSLLLGVVGGAFIPSDTEIRIEGWRFLWLGLFWAGYLVGVPMLAGYFTARYASNRPQLHVLLVALVGIALIFGLSTGPLGPRAGVGIAFLAMVALGAFLFLRRKRVP